jgi:rare lipoprotein A
VRPTNTPKIAAWLALVALALGMVACGGEPALRPNPHVKIGASYTINGVRYTPAAVSTYDTVGTASWYGEPYHGRLTANGEVFDKEAFTAAHPTLPLPSLVEVTHLDNGRRMVLRLNDRGPFIKGRIIDLSQAAARELGFEQDGLAPVRVVWLGPADLEDATLALGEPPRRWEIRVAEQTHCRSQTTSVC